MSIPSRCSAVIGGLLLLGCNTPDGPSRLASRPAEPPPVLSRAEITERVHALPPWPSNGPPLTDNQWLLLARTAEEMQHVEATTLRETLTDYISGPEPKFELDRASRGFLLLRVMFDLRSEPYDERRHPVHPLSASGGFCGGYTNMSDEQIEVEASLVSWPIRWTGDGPELLAWLGGYNGPPYDVGKDIINLREHYGLRDLKPIIAQLERKVQNQGDSR